MKLVVGARVTHYEKYYDDRFSVPYTATSSGEVTPYAGLIYDFHPNYSAYASYTDIFRPQQQRDLSGRQLDPVVGKSIEAGVKGSFMDGQLNASAAVFQVRQDKLAQVLTGSVIPGTGPGTGVPAETAYRMADGATSRGFEFELSGELARGWNANAGYSQFKAQDANDVDVNTIYPRKVLRVFTTYRLPGELDALTIGGGVNWESTTYIEADNPFGVSERIEQKGFALLNLMARYQFTSAVSAQLNVSNLTDKKFFRVFNAYNQMTYGEGRRVSASLRYSF